jgi:hypothetical protein
LVNDPKLADDRQAQYRYNAACAAVLAAASMNTTAEGEGKMSDAERAVLRQKALILLQTELDTWSKLLETENEEQRQRVAKTLHHWRDTDSDLSSVRDEAELAKLPESERVEWKALWKRVDELIAKSTSTEEKRDH